MKRVGLAAGAALLVCGSLLSYGRPALAATQAGSSVRAAALAVTPPTGAVDQGQASASAPVDLEVVLAPSDPAGLQSLLAGLYDPSSPDYHHWLSPQQFESRFGPAPAALAAAQAWLGGKGLDVKRSSTFALSVRASTAQVGRAMGTAFHRYRASDGQTGLVARGAPLVPVSLRPDITAINGLSTLPAFKSSRRVAKPASAVARPALAASSATALQACSTARSVAQSYGAYTMDQLSSEYGIGSLQSAGLTGAGQTVAVYELSPYSSSDVAQYQSCFGLGNSVSRVSVDGGATDPTGTPEADLDIEQIATQAPGATIVSYEAPNTNQGWYDLWSSIVNGNQAQVVSTSWGLCEADAWQYSQTSASTSVLLAQAAAQGQTVTAASGDSGSEGCAQDYPNGAWSSLGVDYPASDPNVIAVGGTDYNSPGSESVWNGCSGASNPMSCASNVGFQAAAGGGESTHEARKSWQPSAAGDPGYQCSGQACREVPDISANAGVPMVDYDSGGWSAGEGTSYASPLVAGMVADRNQGCSGRPGNLAPLLYSAAASSLASASLQDVTQGSNDMLGNHSGSYRAGPGYDLASGLGTPVGAGLACPDVVSVTQNAGPGGTVTVSGVGLENARILFGAVPAVVQSENSTSATVVVPTGTGTVIVSATSPNGTGSMTAPFAYAGSTGTGTGTGTGSTGTGSTGTTSPPTNTTTASANPPGSASACPGTAGGSLPGAAGVAAVSINGCDGYYVADSAGQVSAFGAAVSHGDLSGYHLAAPIIAIEATPDGNGYWLLGADGGVFTFGDAHFFGSTGGIALHAPVVGMAVTPDSRGYWMVARDGGVFSFGDARFFGSTGNVRLAAPVDGIAVAPGGSGYWLVASDGGVFTFTRDGFYGSLGGVHLAKPVVGMSSTPDGRGYTLVGSDGGVFTFGDAPFYGSLGGHPPASPVVDLSPAPANDGYYLVTSGGAVYNFGPGTRYYGSV